MIRTRLTGIHEAQAKLRRTNRKLGEKLEQGLKKCGEFLLGKAQEVVPVDTGKLHDSGFVETEGSGWDTKVFVGFSADYAIFVHEMTHLKHAPGKQAKFLEGPAREYLGPMLRTTALEVTKLK